MTGDKYSLNISKADEGEYAVRIFLAEGRSNKFQISCDDGWQAVRAADAESGKFQGNARALENLNKYIQAVLKVTNEPLELFIFSSAEMNSDDRWKTSIGKTAFNNKEIELKAGDLLKIDPDEKITPLALPALANHVEKPKEAGDMICSFCAQPQTAVKKLISGPSVTICDECVDLCNNILDDEFEETCDDEFGRLDE